MYVYVLYVFVSKYVMIWNCSNFQNKSCKVLHDKSIYHKVSNRQDSNKH